MGRSFRLLLSHPSSFDCQEDYVNIFVQAKNETVVINGDIYVTVVEILEDEVVLAIDAPEWVAVCRKEIGEERELTPVRPR
jgi:carbon storage regulator CsrA